MTVTETMTPKLKSSSLMKTPRASRTPAAGSTRSREGMGPLSGVSDASLLRRFEARRIHQSEWSHAEHCRIAFIYLKVLDWADAVDRMRRNIKRLNEAQGVPNSDTRGYHETMTITWMRLVASAMERADHERDSLVFLEANPALLDKHLPEQHYSPRVLKDLSAREHFVPPDRKPLP